MSLFAVGFSLQVPYIWGVLLPDVKQRGEKGEGCGTQIVLQL